MTGRARGVGGLPQTGPQGAAPELAGRLCAPAHRALGTGRLTSGRCPGTIGDAKPC